MSKVVQREAYSVLRTPYVGTRLSHVNATSRTSATRVRGTGYRVRLGYAEPREVSKQ